MTKSRPHEDKSTLILTHGDSDGVCSGAIAKSAFPEGDVYFTSPVGIIDDLNLADGYENVIICDIAVDEKALHRAVLKDFAEIASVSDLTYIDHHPLPEKCITADWLHHDLYRLCFGTSHIRFFRKDLAGICAG